MEPSFLSTGTIGAAQSENWTGSITSALHSRSSSAVTFSLSAYGTSLAQKKARSSVLLNVDFDRSALYGTHSIFEQVRILV